MGRTENGEMGRTEKNGTKNGEEQPEQGTAMKKK